jgi:hypothetical protein
MADASATKVTSKVIMHNVSGSLLEIPNNWLRTALISSNDISYYSYRSATMGSTLAARRAGM